MYFLTDFCVCCLNKTDDLIKLSKICESTSLNYAFKMTASIRGTACKELDTTKSICFSCRRMIDIIYDFRQTCMNSKRTLKNYVSQLRDFACEKRYGTLSVNVVDFQRLRFAVDASGRTRGSKRPRKLSKMIYNDMFVHDEKEMNKERPAPSQSAVKIARKCPECILTFHSLKSLTLHREQHRRDVFHCRFCAIPFGSYYPLVAHEKTHLSTRKLLCVVQDSPPPVEKLLWYKCRRCSVIFSSRKCLRNHMKVHEKEVVGGLRVSYVSRSRLEKFVSNGEVAWEKCECGVNILSGRKEAHKELHGLLRI